MLTATASDAHGFRIVLSLSLFSLIYFGRAHELSRDMFFPLNHVRHVTHAN